MHVAIVSPPYVPVPPLKYGGTERVIYFLIKGLLELGHEVTLLAPADSQVECNLIPICDHSMPFLATKEEDKKLDPFRKAAEEKSLVELRKILPTVDIIHSHGVDLKDFGEYSNLTTIHGHISLLNMSYFEERQNLYFASISKNQQEAFPDLNYVGVVYNGLDPAPFPLVTKPEDYLCFIGRFDRDKNPHLAIHLAIKLGMKLKMAGKIDLAGREYFKEEVEPYLDHPLIEYIGEVGLEDKIELISKAKCNLHPTGWREPFGLTVLESAYCGTPTLAINAGSMPELIEDGRTGLLVEDYSEGYHSINECFAMNREYISQRARTLFNYRTMSEQYVLAYNKVIELVNKRHESDGELVHLVKGIKDQLNNFWKKNTSDFHKD